MKLILMSCLLFFSCKPNTKYTVKGDNGEKYYTDEIYNWGEKNCITFWDLDLNGIGKKTKICDCYTIIENK
jgi:hypothetical protein